MSKELKSLERIENYQVVVDIEKDKTATIKELLPSSCEAIRTALKEKENIEKTINELFSENGKVITTIDIKKKLKALEIIKKKRVECWLLNSVFLNGDKVEIYNELLKLKHNELTQEEYDLLKEVLL